VPPVATEKSPVTPTGIDPETVRLVAQCLNHYATPGHLISGNLSKIKKNETKCFSRIGGYRIAVTKFC
jgi:hypothetical protein